MAEMENDEMNRRNETMTELWWRNTGLTRFADAATELFESSYIREYGGRLQIPLGNLELDVPESIDLEQLSRCISEDGIPAVVWHYSSDRDDADVIVRIHQGDRR